MHSTKKLYKDHLFIITKNTVQNASHAVNRKLTRDQTFGWPAELTLPPWALDQRMRGAREGREDRGQLRARLLPGTSFETNKVSVLMVV